MGFSQKVTVGGVDVSSFVVKWRVFKDKTNQNINKALVIFTTDVFDSVTIDNAVALIIQKGTDSNNLKTLFTGEIENWDFGSGVLAVDARDPFWNLKRKLLTKSYNINVDASAGKIAGSTSIFEDLIETQAELSSRSTDSGTVDTIDEFICNDDFIQERAITLAKILDWQIFWDDSTSEVVLEPEGTNNYTTDLIVGGNVQNMPRWKKNIAPMINYFKIKGAVRRDTITEEFSGDDATTTFTLTNTPKDTEVTVDGTLKTRGVTNSTISFDYIVNEDRKQIVFSTAPPSTAADNVDVKYTANVPIPVIVRNQASIDSYRQQDGHREFDDIRTVSDAIARGRKIIRNLGTPFNSTVLNTIGEFGMTVGMKVRVVDTQQDKDLELTIQSITYQYPEGYDIVSVGDKDFRLRDLFSSINARIRELEKRGVSNQDILTQLFDWNREISIKRRYFKFQKLDTTGDGEWGVGFGDGISLNGLAWGAAGAVWQGSFTNTAVDNVIIQGNNVYEELFYDNDFKGSGATWNTTTKSLEFTSGQVHTGGLISLGITHTFFTATLGATTGDITTEISGDGGSTYQTVTLGVRTAFTNADAAGVKFKFTESGASTATILSDINANGKIDAVGIKCVLEGG